MRYADLNEDQHAVFDEVAAYTQTSRERIVTLIDAVGYVVRGSVPGDVVECGVWRGGSAMTMAMTLLKLGAHDRCLWLYDTFTQMPPATMEDRDYAGRSMVGERPPNDPWTCPPASEVQALITSTGYPADRVRCIQGMVEETIPTQAPDRIALLRLDTDWYSSTRHELEHLYPRLQVGGVLIVDDYGHFLGARQAVDEYFADRPILLVRVDYTCRMAVKLPEGKDSLAQAV